MATILVIHGPNLNMLGTREPEKYGKQTLAEIDAKLSKLAAQHQHQLDAFQSNSEAAIIDRIHQAHGQADFILINPAALTHTSIGLRDALLAVSIPFIEIHLSNIHGRESFRQTSYISDIATGVISGLGASGYELALQWVAKHLSN